MFPSLLNDRLLKQTINQFKAICADEIKSRNNSITTYLISGMTLNSNNTCIKCKALLMRPCLNHGFLVNAVKIKMQESEKYLISELGRKVVPM